MAVDGGAGNAGRNFFVTFLHGSAAHPTVMRAYPDQYDCRCAADQFAPFSVAGRPAH